LLACRRFGSAVTAGIGAQGLQQRLVEEVALISPALLSLHTHRVGSDCSLLQDSALQPPTPGRRCPTMAPADLPPPAAARRRTPARDRPERRGDLPGSDADPPSGPARITP